MARRQVRPSTLAGRRRRQASRRPTRRIAPTRALAQTYLERFEAETPRAPSPALEGLVQPGERSPAFAGLAGQQPQQVTRFPSLPVSGVGGFALQRGEFQPRIGGGLFERMAQGPAQMAAIYQSLGVNLGQQFPGSIFGTAPAEATTPAYSKEYWSRWRQSGGLYTYVRIAKRLMSGLSDEPLYDPGAYYPGGAGGAGGGGVVVVRGGGTPGSQGRNYSSGLVNWRI